MLINYKREIYALAHLNLSTASFKCLGYLYPYNDVKLLRKFFFT